MTRNTIMAVVLAALAVIWIGCSNPAQDAQKMFAAGQYEQLVAKYAADPNLAGVVQQAKDKIAERLFNEQKYDSLLMVYPTSPLVPQAKSKLAERAFMMGNYQEVIVKYPETQWAMMAKAKMDSIANAANPAQPGKPGQPPQTTNPPQGGAKAQLEKDAQAELDRILAIKLDRARTAALQTFANDAKWAGTAAQAKAKAMK